jgi:hypothetical protein
VALPPLMFGGGCVNALADPPLIVLMHFIGATLLLLGASLLLIRVNLASVSVCSSLCIVMGFALLFGCTTIYCCVRTNQQQPLLLLLLQLQ